MWVEVRMLRGPTAAIIIALATAAGCASAPQPTASTASYRTVLEGTGAQTASAVSLVADRPTYDRGDTIELSLVNRGAVTYGRDADGCRQPLSVWLRDAAGQTYFLRSGERRVCADAQTPITPGRRAALVDIDSALVWLDRSSSETLYRVPAPLPAGRYSVHANLPVGELVTAIEIR